MSATFWAKDKTCGSCKHWTGARTVPNAFSRTVTVDGDYNKEEMCNKCKKKTSPKVTCPLWEKMDKINM